MAVAASTGRRATKSVPFPREWRTVAELLAAKTGERISWERCRQVGNAAMAKLRAALAEIGVTADWRESLAELAEREKS